MRTLQNIVAITSLILVLANTSFPQNIYEDSVVSIIKKAYGAQYDIYLTDLNLILNKKPEIGHRMKDLFKKLSNCQIFIADAPRNAKFQKPKTIVGIVRGGQILWRSEDLAGSFSGLSSSISTIDDINKDGMVDVVISEETDHGDVVRLWIFSWDGEKGRNITQCDESSCSLLLTESDYKLVDVNNDGITEIQASWYENTNSKKTSKVIYSWNGNLYGKWQTSKELRNHKSK